MLAVMSAALGLAVNGHNNLVTNFYNGVLHLSGPQFGYITAIREVGGFVLIFLTALLYRISLQRVTAGALVVLAAGYALFSLAHGFWTVIPWVLITSFGVHTVAQTQAFLAMSLTTASRSGSILGRLGAIGQGGTLAALLMVFLAFKFKWLSYRPTFFILGGLAFLGAIAIVRFPHLHEGQPRQTAPERQPIVWNRAYHLYYWIALLDGARQQVFFSFGLWVLVSRFGLSVEMISLVLLAVTFATMFTTPRFGRAVDRYGERRTLSFINVAFVVALAGYAFAPNVVVACVFYCVYTIIGPLAPIGNSTYIRKICAPADLAPSLAMGLTLAHATAVVVPVAAGFILNYVGYQVPFFLACGVAMVTFFVTLRLDPVAQRCPARVAADEAVRRGVVPEVRPKAMPEASAEVSALSGVALEQAGGGTAE